MNVESLDYTTEAWIRKAISNGIIRRHQNTKCLNCGKMGHLKKNCRQGIPGINVFSRNGKNRNTQPTGICKKCGLYSLVGPMNVG